MLNASLREMYVIAVGVPQISLVLGWAPGKGMGAYKGKFSSHS